MLRDGRRPRKTACGRPKAIRSPSRRIPSLSSTRTEAVLAGSAAESGLLRVHGLDPLTFSVAPAVVVIGARGATYLPARGAARISPVAAMSRLAR